MDDNTARVLLAVVPATISALVTWRLTKTSEQSQRSQRWWDRKSQAYADVVSSLSHLLHCEEEWLGEYLGENRFTDAYRAKLIERRADAIDSLTLSANAAGFLISSTAGRKLRTTISMLDVLSEPSPDAGISCVKAVRSCIETVLAEASSDLHISTQ